MRVIGTAVGDVTVFGGDQTRPNIHIGDMVEVYRHFLSKPELPSGCYNAGFENISILDIARTIAARRRSPPLALLVSIARSIPSWPAMASAS